MILNKVATKKHIQSFVLNIKSIILCAVKYPEIFLLWLAWGIVKLKDFMYTNNFDILSNTTNCVINFYNEINHLLS